MPKREERHILPCRYCDAPTYMEGGDHWAVTIHNPDGTLHQCPEAEKAQALPIIFRGQMEDACYPLTPDAALAGLRELYDWLSQSVVGEAGDLLALNAAIEVVKLVIGEKAQVGN